MSFQASMISPYQLDDFIQTAYCVAIEIIEDFPVDRKNFKKHFWGRFWSELKVMTSRSVPTYACNGEVNDSLRALSREIEMEGRQDEVENDAREQVVVQAMAPRQMGVLRELLDYGRHTSRDVSGTTHRAARDMGIRRARIRQEHYRQVRVTGEVV